MLRDWRALISRTIGGSDYSGLKMNCASGVHEKAERLILKHIGVTRDRAACKVLDIAAGYGAMSKRLQDAGFTDIQAWDIDSSLMTLPDVPVTAVDLDTAFGAAFPAAFELVVAIEVIEHLENPRHFLRNLAQVLRVGGIALVSTPNIESAASRVGFLRHGGLRWFTRYDRETYGHITPVFSWQMRAALKDAGLTLLETGHNSADALLTVDAGRSETVRALLGLGLYPLMRGPKDGDISLWLCKRTD